MTKDIDVAIPDYCGLSEEELEQRKPNVIAMMERLEAADPVEGGYRFTFPGDHETLAMVTSFIRNERRCCPMADYELALSGTGEPIEFTMQGPEGMQEDIREGLKLERFLQGQQRSAT
ncbi:hypothetical protein BRD56_12850 [Thermoplasmatales archaeon SW_10_69_26]|nr:MAG: hypothetical protein BRD56_12850 [Thermoplasmatales archaeon SW_10_69_26]